MWGIPVREVMRTSSFTMLVIGLAGISFGTATVTVLQIPYLESIGLPTTTAAFTVTFYSLSSLLGRLGFGFLADRYNKRVMLAMCTLMIALGLAFLPFVRTLPQVLAALMLLGPGFGGTIPVRAAMIADNYGTRYFGTLNGLATFVRTIGSGLGPLVVGYTVDHTGAYFVGWLLAAGIVGAGALAVLAERPPVALQQRWQAEAAALAQPSASSG